MIKPSEKFGGFFFEEGMNPLNFLKDPFGFGTRKISRIKAPFEIRQNLNELTVLVTGGSKGIGSSLVDKLTSRGLQIICVSRSKPNASNVVTHLQLDLSDPKDLKTLVSDCPKIDGVVFNAGAMPKEKPTKCNQINIDCLYLLHVLGPAWLTRQLIRLNKFSKQSRVILVTSGGALPTPLNIEYMGKLKEPYNRIQQYAFHKRHQIHLVEYLAQTYIKSSCNFYSMHPGWVATPGLLEGMPSFYNFTKSMLREPADGADTIDWLMCSDNQESGKLYFDRHEVPTNPLPWVPRRPKQIMQFIHKLERQLDELDSLLC